MYDILKVSRVHSLVSAEKSLKKLKKVDSTDDLYKYKIILKNMIRRWSNHKLIR